MVFQVRDVVIDGSVVGAVLANGNQAGPTFNVDWTLANKQSIVLTGNVALTFTNPLNVSNLLLRVTQDPTGSRLLTFPASAKWPGGLAPTLSTAPNAVDLIALLWDGAAASYYCAAQYAFATAF